MKYIYIFLALSMALTTQAQPIWQQRVNTRIEVQLDDKKHELYAYEELEYTNNSPDTLKYIYIHLWPNAYKNDKTPFAKQQDETGNVGFYFSKPKDRGYMDSLQFSINGQNVSFYSLENVPDIARIDLPLYLLSGQKMKVTTPFRVKIPKVFSRLGHTSQAYYLSQWFPKPAVYDTKGWHPISYLDQGEFFSEYGSYDVTITLPKNYVVMATGNCLDEKENEWLLQKSKEPLPKDTLYKKCFPPSDKELKTLHFHEDNVHDFAWFADKRWIVREDTVYSPGNNQLVTAWAAFLPSYQKHWVKATDYLKETVKHYGKWVGPYPYKTIKAVLGDMHAGGGMEYPTVTIIDKGATSQLRTVVIHEAGHNWFYGLLGSNERDHAWMDEGMNTFYEKKTTKALGKDNYQDSVAKNKRKLQISLTADDIEYTGYYEFAATKKDGPVDQTSAAYANMNYGIDVYYKTSLMLGWLESYMGKENFEAGMKDYFDKWHYHHPYPEDFKACMQPHSMLNIDWFFDTILTQTSGIDYKITKATVNGNSTEVIVKNNTGVNAPALIDVCKDDSIVFKAWTKPFAGTYQLSLPVSDWNTLKIDSTIPDYKTSNDMYRRNAFFHRFGLSLKPIMGRNQTYSDRLFLTPLIGYNIYDGFMAGLAFHDITIPENPFRFVIAPMYGFQSHSFTGAASVGYVWHPNNFFREVTIQVDGKSFHSNVTPSGTNEPYEGYQKIAPSLLLRHNEHNVHSTISKTLVLKEYNIWEQNAVATGYNTPSLQTQQKTYGTINYMYSDRRWYNPLSYNLEGQIGADFAKISATGDITIDYNSIGKFLYARGYVGKFFAINSDPAIYSRYELSTSFNGANDYFYDYTYLGRKSQNGISGQQLNFKEGGFKIPVYGAVGTSDDWLASINLISTLPRTNFIRLFFDAGFIPNNAQSIVNSSTSKMLYDGGIQFSLLLSIKLYLPLIMSSDFDNFLNKTEKNKNILTRCYSFTISLTNLNALKIPSSLIKD